MNSSTADLLYLVAAAAFILGLKRLGTPRTARGGNLLAGVGMLVAIVVTLVEADIVNWGWVVAGVAVGSVIGVVAAQRVAMTAMPQMVAAFNGLGGIASALVAAAQVVVVDELLGELPLETPITIVLSIGIGAVTFTGSFVAFGKLQGLITGRPITYPGQQVVNSAIGIGMIASGVAAVATGDPIWYWVMGALAMLIGVLVVLPIGGADMPVVISLLNSFSGLAASAAGFVIENSALIIAGALVGSAGLILTMLMSEAMNRSLFNVLFGAFGGGGDSGGGFQLEEGREVNRAAPEDVAIALGYAESVVVVPGYGLAVSQAQHALRALAEELEARGVTVNYAIHPVAGRMPGHMNVLLAEAEVPYEQLIDLDAANPMFAQTDAVLVVGANDVVNPTARDEPGSPIYGMPILEVDHAGTVIVVKRSLSPGFAGIDNPLFYDDKTLMLFADAKEGLESVTGAMDIV